MGILIVHAAATWFMVGLIWTVQTVHYPLFADVGFHRFPGYEHGHTKRIGRLLVLPAISEVVTAGLLATTRPEGVSAPITLGGGLLLVFIWVLTALVQARHHRRLASGFDPGVHRSLVVGNWWRTGAWTLRGALAAVMLT